jgi:thiosulfate/3-mercaptopyruvate sulfurtransferase
MLVKKISKLGGGKNIFHIFSIFKKLSQSKIIYNKTYFKIENLIETKELAELIKDSNALKKLRILDCSWFLSTDPRNAKELFKTERIPYSQYFDIDEIADKSIDLPHMLPDDSTFISHMKKMDIRKSDNIICYDRMGMFSAPRVWFTFKIFGAPNVSILNGGYPKWEKENLPLEKGDDYRIKNLKRDEPKKDDYDFKLEKNKVVNLEKIFDFSSKIVHKKTDVQIIDCRPPPRYRGEVDEPRPSKRRGNIDGSVNVFFKDLLDENSCFKSPNEIKSEFEKKNVDINKPMILSCGSGTTACVDIFALNYLGKLDNCKLYDGSWAEYVNIIYIL